MTGDKEKRISPLNALSDEDERPYFVLCSYVSLRVCPTLFWLSLLNCICSKVSLP